MSPFNSTPSYSPPIYYAPYLFDEYKQDNKEDSDSSCCGLVVVMILFIVLTVTLGIGWGNHILYDARNETGFLWSLWKGFGYVLKFLWVSFLLAWVVGMIALAKEWREDKKRTMESNNFRKERKLICENFDSAEIRKKYFTPKDNYKYKIR